MANTLWISYTYFLLWARRGWIIKLDVRYKLLLFVLVSVVSFSAKDFASGALLFAVACLIALSMGQWKMTLRYTLLYAGVVAVQLLSPFAPGVLRSILLMLTLCMRMFMPLLLYAGTFVKTTTVSQMVTAMYALKMPRSLTITFAVALRFFPSAKEELHFIQDAMKLRGIGISPQNLLRRPALVFEGVLVPLMMRASTIAEELSAASITRGIDNPGPRTSYNVLRITAKDTAYTVVATAMVLGVLAAKHFLAQGGAG